jgi:hypothetical protein
MVAEKKVRDNDDPKPRSDGMISIEITKNPGAMG